MKTFFHALVFLFICFAAPAWAEVKVAEDAIRDLEKFENWRVGQCIEGQVDWQRSSKNTKNRKVKEIADALDAWCPMDGSVMYLVPAATDECKDDKRNLSNICRKFTRLAGEADTNDAIFFASSFNELMLFTQAVPWKTVSVKNEIAGVVGVTTAQRGNLSVEISAELIALSPGEFSDAEIAAFTGYLEGLGLSLSRDGILYVPFMAIRLYALGMSEKPVYLDITTILDDEGRNPVNLAGEEERIGGRDPFNYFLPLSAGNISHFSNSFAIRITGYGNAKKTEPLYEFTLPLEGFAAVMEDLLAHYRGL